MRVRFLITAILALTLLWPAAWPAGAQSATENHAAGSDETDPETLELFQRAETLRYGVDVPRDADESIRLHGMLADRGYAPSMFRLGEFYYWGRDIPGDTERAVELFQGAADKGYDLALTYLGRALSDLGRTEEALAAYERAVELGARDADLRFAIANLRGDFGDRSDIEGGFAETAQFAGDGETQAQLALADAYRYGRGTDPDPAKSYDLVKQVADGNNPYAVRLLGQYIEDGIGTPADLDAAIAAYRRSIDLGHDYGWVRLGLAQIKAGRLGEAQAALEKAAELGAFSAELTLAKAHYEGDFGDASKKSFGASEIVRLAEAGDVAAGRALLLYHERRSRRLNEADLDLVLANMTSAMEKGDPWATEALLRFYRNLRWLIPNADARRAEIFERFGNQLRKARYVPEELWLAYDRNRPRTSRRVMADIVQDYEGEDFYYGMLELLFIDRNAYTYMVQRELKNAGFYRGPVHGTMTRNTVRSVLRFCRELGVYGDCVHGPLLYSNAKLVVDGLTRRR